MHNSNMKIKTIILSLLTAVSLTANAQGADVLSVEFKDRIPDASLNGKAGVLFIGESGDYVIESSIHEKCQDVKKVNDHYEYRMVIDLKGPQKESRVFIVTKKGTPYQRKTESKDVYVDSISRYSITEINTKLGSTEETLPNYYTEEKGNKPVKACIEIRVPQDLIQKFSLKVNVGEALNAERTSVTEAGNVVFKVVFDTNRFSQLEEALANYQKRLDEIDSLLKVEKDEHVRKGLFDQQDLHDKLKAQVEKDLANARIITIEGENVNTLTIDPNKIRNLKPKALFRYGVVVVEKEVIKEVEKEYSFDELLALARKRYQEYPQHTDFAFYEGAKADYERAMNKCPDAMRLALKAEYDSIMSIREMLYYYEQAGMLADKAERGSANELKYLRTQLYCIQQLLQVHPEISGLNQIREIVREKISANQRPSQRSNVPVKRQRVSGKVSFANELLKRPFGSLQIYSSSTEKVDRKSSSRIGSVNDDGSYSVLIPDYTLYIYVTGEKKAHYIGDGRDELNIEIR